MTKAPLPAAQPATTAAPPSARAAGRSSLTSQMAGGPAASEAAGSEATAGLLHDGDGEPLPSPLRDRFETSLGTDLGGVRVHTDDTAASEAAGHGARAFAVGNNISFGAGEYRPDDPFGQHLIAHEVAHTVQQRGGAGALQPKLAVSSPADAAEHEADRAADAMITGTPASVGVAPLSIARTPAAAYQPPIYEGTEKTKDGANYDVAINWDDPPQLYGIAGTGSSLREMYQTHFKELVATETPLVAIGATAMKPMQIGQRIAKIAETSGKSAAEPYHQALWRCSQRAIVETLDSEHSNRYKKTPKLGPDKQPLKNPDGSPQETTYCNVYGPDMVNAMGGYLPRVWYAEDLTSKNKVDPAKLEKNQKIGLNANQIGQWLHKYGADFGWRAEASTEKAQQAANSGRVVIIQASKTNPAESGHVNIILAEGNHHSAGFGEVEKDHWKFQPLQSQAGVNNYKYSDSVTDPKKKNSPGWWEKQPMKKEEDGNCWIYEGAQQKTAVGDALGMGGVFN